MTEGPPVKTCPTCSGPLNPILVRNSLSRYTNDYICNECGRIEAFALGAMNRLPGEPREVLYYDGTGPIMLVTEDEPGFIEIFPWRGDKTASEQAWIKDYVEKVNTRHGLTPGQAHNVVASSMFAQRIL
jgi:hypothetical protein